ncbi:MAG: O-antigen ligase family protein [Verrucomicrobiota bacterium]
MTELAPRRQLHLHQDAKQPGSLGSALWLLVLLATGPLVLGGARTWIILPVYAGIGLLILFQALRLWTARPAADQRFGDAVDLLVALFVVYAFCLYWAMPVGFAARLEMFNIAVYAAVFWFCRYGMPRVSHQLLVLAGLLLVAAGIGVFAFFLWKNQDWLVYGTDLHVYYHPRLCGTYGCPNHFGYLAAVGTGIALSFVLFSRVSWVWRIVCFYLAALLVAGVFFSLSRGSWLALGAAGLALTLLALRAGQIKWYWPVLGFGVMMILGVAAVQTHPSMRARVDMAMRYFQGVDSGDQKKRDITSYVRVELARDALNIFQDYPVWGTGPASFNPIHQRYQKADYTTKAVYTHNDYLNALTDYGAVGAGLILAFIGLTSWRLFSFTSGGCTPGELVVLGSCWGAWAAIVLHSVVDFNLHIPGNALIVFALTGMGLSVTQRHQSRRLWLPASSLRRPLAVTALAVGLALTGLTAWTARGYYTYAQVDAQKEVLPFPESIAQLEGAAAIDPYNEQIPKLLGDLYRVQASQHRLSRDYARTSELAQQAADWYRRAGEVAPLNDEFMLLRAQVHDLMLRHDEAYLMYQRAIDLRPFNGYYHYLLGRHYLNRGLVDEARQAFNRGATSPHGKEENRQILKVMNMVANREKKAQKKAEKKAQQRARRAAQGKPVAEEEVPFYDPATTP